jgi:hypothetical protein
MPFQDWTRVPDGIFHHFHHEWISEICRALNRGLLPAGYYALDEQTAAGLGPDVLTLQASPADDSLSSETESEANESSGGTATTTLIQPKTTDTAISDGEYYRRKKSSVVVRHVSNDRVVAIVEILSPGNKASKHAFQALLDKTWEMLAHRVHMLFVDPFPPSRRDTDGLHAAIWDTVQPGNGPGSEGRFVPPPDKPLTLVAYESELIVKAYAEFVAVGESLPNMPLILEPGAAVSVPLEATYQSAFAAVPHRWRRVLEAPVAE